MAKKKDKKNERPEATGLEIPVPESTWADRISLGEIIRGLAKPRASGEYRRARLALERLQAPILAVLIPVVFIVMLLVVTATVQTSKQKFEVEVARQTDEVDLDTVEEDDPPEDAPDMVAADPDAVVVDMSIDIPMPSAAPAASVAPGPAAPAPRLAQMTQAPVFTRIVAGTPTKTLEGGSFGTLIGNGKGGGKGGGGVPEGYLLGEMFDFKRDADGNEIPGWNPGMYWAQARKLINDGKFGPTGEKDVYKVPAKVALNKIWIPVQSADNGPKAFGVGDKMKPRGWVAHYSATLKSKSEGKFRFVGEFDDFMACFVNGKLVMEVNWANLGDHPTAVFGWKSPVGKSPYGIDVVGDWFELKKGQSFRFDICVGERPGGAIQGRLMIEKEGAEYKKDGKGRPILPLFTSRRLTFKELDKIKKNNEAGGPESGGLKFAEEFTSLFKLEDTLDNGKGKRAKKDKAKEDNLGIEVDI